MAISCPSFSLLQARPPVVTRCVVSITEYAHRRKQGTYCALPRGSRIWYAYNAHNCCKWLRVTPEPGLYDMLPVHRRTTPSLYPFRLQRNSATFIRISHLVKEGDLLKVCNGGPRRYKFVLFSDMLVYGTETMRAKLQRDHRKYKVCFLSVPTGSYILHQLNF